MIRRSSGALLVLTLGGLVLGIGESFAAAVIELMLATGEALEAYAEGQASRELTALPGRAPQDVHRYADGGLVATGLVNAGGRRRNCTRPSRTVP